MPNSPVGLDEQIKCVARELRIRERVYPNWVSAGRMKLDAAEREIATMAAVLATLEGLRELEADGWRLIESYTPPLDPSNVLIAGQYPNGLWYVEESFYWRSAGVVAHFSDRLLNPPTHWRPLPAPPGTSDGGEG